MNRAAFRRFEFFETEVLAKDIVQKFVSLYCFLFSSQFGCILNVSLL